MHNFFLSIKGFVLISLSYIGIEILFKDHFLHIKILEDSVGWWFVNVILFLITLLGVHSIYIAIKKAACKYTKENIREIKKIKDDKK